MKLLLKVCIRYGLVAGLLSLILLIAIFYVGRHPFLIAPFLDFRILTFGVFIFFSLKEFRDYYQGGVLYFWQGMIGSGVVVMTATVVSSIGLQIFGTLEQDFVSAYVTQLTAYLNTFPKEVIDQIGKDVFERNLKELPATHISTLVQTHFAQGLVIGFFISIILSVILRKQPKI